MKIAIDISQIVFPGGVGKYTRKLVENLLEQDNKNQYILLAYSLRQKSVFDEFTDGLKNYKNWGLRYIPLPISMLEPVVNKWCLPSLEVLAGKVDLYHASDWIQFPSKAKIVSTVHDLAPIIYPQFHDKKIVKVFSRRLRLLKKCDGLICVSESTKRDLERYFAGYSALTPGDAQGATHGVFSQQNLKDFGQGYPGFFGQQKIKVIYEAGVVGSDSPSALTPGDARTATPGVSGHMPYVLTVSGLNPRKNIKRLLKAFAIFHQYHPDYKLVVAGAFGWGEKFANQHNIEFVGDLSDLKLIEFYKNAELFVYPSLYEGFGLSVLEAMGFKLPVVTSNVSSLPEIAGEAAILVDPKDERAIAVGMEEALEAKKELIKNGLKQVKKFGWEKCARETLAFYKKIVISSDHKS